MYEKYFGALWPRWNPVTTMRAFRLRFDLRYLYKNLNFQNCVYYVQSRADEYHAEHHDGPFRDASGIQEESGTSANSRAPFELYHGEVKGHGQISPSEYETFIRMYYNSGENQEVEIVIVTRGLNCEGPCSNRFLTKFASNLKYQ